MMNSSFVPLYNNIRKQLESEADAVRRQIAEADRHSGEISLNAVDDDLESSPVASAIDSVIHQAKSELPEKAHASNQAKEAEKAFVSKHNLLNKGFDANPVVSTLLLAIGVFGDSFVNAAFFHSAHLAASHSAALLVAFLISLTNATSSAFAGFFIGRFKAFGAHASGSDAEELATTRRRATWQFNAYIAVISFYILTIGLVRSTESLDRVQHSLGNYLELLVTPEAISLILINCAIAVFSYHKGRTGFAHPYGGYSECQKGVTTASDELYAVYDDAIEAIEDICDDFSSEESDAAKLNRKAIAKYNNSVTACHDAHRELLGSIRQAESALLADVNRALDTASVEAGKRQSLPEGFMDQFSFDDIAAIDLPPFYKPPEKDQAGQSLQTLRTDALQRLAAVLQDATRP